MLEATEAVRNVLSGVTAQAVLVQREDRDPGRLPPAKQVVPDRDLDTLKDDPVAGAYRELFWQMDVDPTKQRPAGEALARRVVQEGALPRIAPVVDAYNLASARTLVPFSAFDADELDGSLVLDVADGEEAFDPIGEEPVTVEEGRPVWRDGTGVTSLFLHRDGQRTAIGDGTDRVWVVAAGPVALVPRVLPEAIRVLESYMEIAGWRVAKGPVTLKL